MVYQGRAAYGPGAASVQHGSHLPQCGNPAYGSGVWLASKRAGEQHHNSIGSSAMDVPISLLRTAKLGSCGAMEDSVPKQIAYVVVTADTTSVAILSQLGCGSIICGTSLARFSKAAAHILVPAQFRIMYPCYSLSQTCMFTQFHPLCDACCCSGSYSVSVPVGLHSHAAAGRLAG